MLHGLELGNRLAELLPFPDVLDSVIERPLGQADHLRADPDASFVQRLDRDLVAFAGLAEDVRARDQALLEQQLARAAGANPELVLLLANGEPGDAALDEKRGDAAVPGFRVDVRKDNEQVGFVAVGDPQLAAAQRPVVAALARACRKGERIAARAGLRQGISADRVQRERRKIAPLDIVVPPAQQRIDHERVLDVDEHADRRIHA